MGEHMHFNQALDTVNKYISCHLAGATQPQSVITPLPVK